MTRKRWLIGSLLAFVLLIALFAIAATVSFRELVTAPFRETEMSKNVLEGLLAHKNARMTSLLRGDRFCVLGVGRDPYSFAKLTFPNYSYKNSDEDDPFFLRSDSHWHIIVLLDVTKNYDVVPIPTNKLVLRIAGKQPLCAADLNLAVETHLIEGRVTPVLVQDKV